MRPLPISIVQNAITLLHQGKSCWEVSKALHISVTTAQKIRKRLKDNIPAPRRGRPFKVPRRTRRVLARKIYTGDIETLPKGQKYVRSVEGVQVNTRSIRNYLKMEGLKTYLKPKKPGLTDAQKKLRYQFAKKHLHWTVDDWKNVMFSDETIIRRVDDKGRRYYYKRPGEKFLRPHQIKKAIQGGGGRMMIWGCITYYGVGDASWIPDNMNADSYISVLKDYVFASRDWNDMDPEKFIFQQDNASVHTAKSTMSYIKKSNIPLMEWPPNSPDINIIETVWSYLKDQLNKYTEDVKTLKELWERVQDIWDNIPIDFIQELYESMPKRMRDIIKAKGGAINY